MIKVNPSLSVKADTTQTICLGGNSTLIAKVTGGTPGYSYTWSPTAGISSASTKTPNATPLTNTTYTVVISDTNKCTAQDSVFIKVLSPVGNNSIMPGQFICYNTIPSTIIGSNPTGGNGIFSYQWQDSTSGVAWADIITATSQNYTPVALKKTTYFRRKVSSSACTGKQINISVFDTLTVDPQIFPNAHPTSSFICNGVTDTLDASLSTGGTGKFTYAWKSSPKGFASTLKKPSTGSLSI